MRARICVCVRICMYIYTHIYPCILYIHIHIYTGIHRKKERENIYNLWDIHHRASADKFYPLRQILVIPLDAETPDLPS